MAYRLALRYRQVVEAEKGRALEGLTFSRKEEKYSLGGLKDKLDFLTTVVV